VLRTIAVDWKRRLLEIGLAGGVASGTLACEQKPCVNCVCEQKFVSTSIDKAIADTGPVAVDGGPGGPTVWQGCPVPESSPPAAYGPIPNSGGMCRPPTPSEPFVYQPVANDDDSLGYTGADVLNAINNSQVGDLLWMDGTRTKLRMSVPPGQLSVSVYDPPPGACYRSLSVSFPVTLTSDDGRLSETLSGNVTTYDEGGPFDVNHVIVQLDTFGDGYTQPWGPDGGVPIDAGSTGTLRSLIPGLLGVSATARVNFTMRFVLKGSTCSYYWCDPGEVAPSGNCFPPSGLILVSVDQPPDLPGATCIDAYVASWKWE
jgi:hypothetical protein